MEENSSKAYGNFQVAQCFTLQPRCWQAQFEAEQEQMKAISYLSADGQKEYAARQSIAFMYMKPPGLDAALSKVQPGNDADG